MSDMRFEASLVRSLLEEQHPDLAGLELREVAGGWDNHMWRLGQRLAVRLPRTPRGPQLLRKEHRWVPTFASRLPLPVSAPVRIGTASKRFPQPWLITTWVAGEPGDRATIVHGSHAAQTLADFLRALHRTAPAGAPVNPQRGVPLRELAYASDGLRGVDVPGHDPDRIWADAMSALEWKKDPVWIHGDLHPANVVVANGTLAGIIDFGDLGVGDPATDLSAAWLLLPAGKASDFFAGYGDVDDATIRRARGWALWRCLGLIEIGRNGEAGIAGGKPSWKPAGEAALARVLANDPKLP